MNMREYSTVAVSMQVSSEKGSIVCINRLKTLKKREAVCSIIKELGKLESTFWKPSSKGGFSIFGTW